MRLNFARLTGVAIVLVLTAGCAAAIPSTPTSVPFWLASPSPTPVAAAQATGIPRPTAMLASASASPTLAVMPGVLDGPRKVGNCNVTLFSSPNPPGRGNNVLAALVTDADGKLLTDATVSFDLDMTNMSHGKNVVQAKVAADGRYMGQVSFQMGGPWRAIVTVSSPSQPEASARFVFTVSR